MPYATEGGGTSIERKYDVLIASTKLRSLEPTNRKHPLSATLTF
jgi:hypothetical protein